jgi:DNA-binding transcriptional ArsR family regulator
LESTRPLEAETASFRRAPADPTRRRILRLLRAGPAVTGEITAAFPISRIAVTRHLEVLAEAGLIASRKRAGGVGTVSTLSRWSGCAGAGLDRSGPASPRDSPAYRAGRNAGALRVPGGLKALVETGSAESNSRAIGEPRARPAGPASHRRKR